VICDLLTKGNFMCSTCDQDEICTGQCLVSLSAPCVSCWVNVDDISGDCLCSDCVHAGVLPVSERLTITTLELF
jgi:hypothetical protein